MAARVLRVKLPESPYPWWELFECSFSDIDEICVAISRLYQRPKADYIDVRKIILAKTTTETTIGSAMQRTTSPCSSFIVSPGHHVAPTLPKSEKLSSPSNTNASLSVDLTLVPNTTESKTTPDKTHRPDDHRSRDREKPERHKRSRDRDREDKGRERDRVHKERDRDRDRDLDDKDRDRDRDRERNNVTDKYESYSKYSREYDRHGDKDRHRSRKRRSSPYD